MNSLYVITPFKDGPCKVGFTKNLPKRLDTLQVGNWNRLFVAYSSHFYIPSSRGATLGLGEMFVTAERAACKIEKATHKTLDGRGLHISGEWFACGPDEAIAAIKAVADVIGAKPVNPLELEKYVSLWGGSATLGTRAKNRELGNMIETLRYGQKAVEAFHDEAMFSIEHKVRQLAAE